MVKKGFQRFSPDQLRAATHNGGVKAHQNGFAHEWTSEEARAAGRKGGETSARRRREWRALLRHMNGIR